MNNIPTVIITGANAGIGRATTLELATRGYGVLLGVRNPSSVSSVMVELNALGRGPAHILPVDLSEPAEIKSFVMKICQLGLNVCGLVNNGGVCRLREQLTSIGVEYTLAVNAFGSAILLQLLLNEGVLSSRGKIINVGSHVLPKSLDRMRIEGRRTFSIRDAYMQSKLAMLLFALGVAKDIPLNVCEINTIFPGVIRTKLGRESVGTRLLGALFDPFIEAPSKAARRIANLFEQRGDRQGAIFNKESIAAITYEGDMDADIMWLMHHIRHRFTATLSRDF